MVARRRGNIKAEYALMSLCLLLIPPDQKFYEFSVLR